ncbi:pollen-specific leucine-rich repeat extensin-like protein 2 [Varanus komodoensis]|uniref:pollen-specific leucine-rich repeat extensin-like protein 2 n=1 Tax=Varanus komodoensis TaxID=61221 RepID=UPI001CF772AB|nr:pollen-specific leucine-rich repeat extensin-like protein 2 [Varanus komodoensis]
MAQCVAFRKCSKCGAKMSPADPHELCLLCLGEGHRTDKCRRCLAFTKQARRNRENRLRKILWDQALLASDELAAQPMSAGPSMVTSPRPSKGAASKEISRSSHSLRKQKEKRKHSDHGDPLVLKKAEKDKLGKAAKKRRPTPEPRRDSDSTVLSVPTAPLVPTASAPTPREMMQVTPPGSSQRVEPVDLIMLHPPEPIVHGSMSEGEIRDSPPRSLPCHQPARLPTPVPSSPEASRRTMAVEPVQQCRSLGQSTRAWIPMLYEGPEASQPQYWGPPPFGYYMPRDDSHQSHQSRMEAPSTSAPTTSRHPSPLAHSSSSPPYPYDSVSEDSDDCSTSPAAVISTQGPGLPEES